MTVNEEKNNDESGFENEAKKPLKSSAFEKHKADHKSEAGKDGIENQESKKIVELEAKVNENWDLYLRARADIENVKRRTQADLEKAHKYANEKFAKEIIMVFDSLEKGIEATETGENDLNSIKEGMELTMKLLVDTFEKFGIKVIDPKGQVFDPVQHEALTAQPTNDVPANSVITVVQKGFTIHDRILRPARVIVAKAID